MKLKQKKNKGIFKYSCLLLSTLMIASCSSAVVITKEEANELTTKMKEYTYAEGYVAPTKGTFKQNAVTESGLFTSELRISKSDYYMYRSLAVQGTENIQESWCYVTSGVLYVANRIKIATNGVEVETKQYHTEGLDAKKLFESDYEDTISSSLVSNSFKPFDAIYPSIVSETFDVELTETYTSSGNSHISYSAKDSTGKELKSVEVDGYVLKKAYMVDKSDYNKYESINVEINACAISKPDLTKYTFVEE